MIWVLLLYMWTPGDGGMVLHETYIMEQGSTYEQCLEQGDKEIKHNQEVYAKPLENWIMACVKSEDGRTE